MAAQSIICYVSTIMPYFRIYIIIDREVRAPGHVKDAVGGINSRYKQMLKLEISKLLNIEFNSR